MKILALEFSSSQRSVAVVHRRMDRPAETVGEAIETGGRAGNAFAMIDEVLRAAGWEREQIECLAVGLGPGSYTGIRAAISIAQGWQLARATPLLGISSVDCLAAQARADGLSGRVHFVIDAQRNEFYLAAFDLNDAGSISAEPLRIVTFDEVFQRGRQGALLAGPDAPSRFPGARSLFPRASLLGKLALERRDFVRGETLEPIYLRETNFVKAPLPRTIPP